MKRIKNDNRGSSLVLVLISMTFMTLLALTIITMTITNIRLKASQKGSQENFYTTDSVLDAIIAGIQNESSKISANAYTVALSEYSAVLAGSTYSLDEKYATSYQDKMLQLLSEGECMLTDDPSTKYYYKDDVLKAYLPSADAITYQDHASGKETIEIDGYSLVLKNVQIIQTKGSYETKITTDIRVDVPEVDTEAHSEYLGYAILADDQIIANAVNASIHGNVYAGTVNRDTTNDTTGILISGASGGMGNLDIVAKNIITRGDIKATNGASVSISGDAVSDANIWVENLLTGTGTIANKISIDGICNVADDLELNGIQDEVKLSGSYFGYNYNDTYDNPSDLTTDASYSSAILLNGKDDKLDLSNLSTLILSGRTFISKKVSDTESINGIVNDDIELGESLAVKSNQLAYFISGEHIEYVGVYGDTIPGYGTDDRYYFDYNGTGIYAFDYLGYNEYIGITDFNIMDYVDLGQPIMRYYRDDPAVGRVEYSYLKFATQKKAGEFYQTFYSKSVQQKVLDSVNEYYVAENGITLNGGDVVLCSSGNIMYSDTASGNLKLKIQNNDTYASSVLTQYATAKSKEYVSRQLALIKDYAEVYSKNIWRLSSNPVSTYSKSGSSDNTNLFSILIPDSSTITNYEGVLYEGVVAISDGDYTWESSKASYLGTNSGIIIALGDVTVNADFSGMIIAGGDVTIGSTGITISSNEELIESMFLEDKKTDAPVFYNLFSQYFRKSVDATIGSNSDEKPDNVNYQNWTRN